MKNEELETITSRIIEKIGDENSALIVDDLTEIITKNKQIYDERIEKDNQIQKLKNDKERLIETNGKLFQQIPIGKEEKNDEKIEEKKEFSFFKMFDEKGNFIK